MKRFPHLLFCTLLGFIVTAHAAISGWSVISAPTLVNTSTQVVFQLQYGNSDLLINAFGDTDPNAATDTLVVSLNGMLFRCKEDLLILLLYAQVLKFGTPDSVLRWRPT